MFPRRPTALVILAIAAIGLFLAECAIFHFPAGTGIDVVWLAGLTLLPGTFIVLILRQFLRLDLEAHEILSLGTAVGFGIPPMLLGILHGLHIHHASTIYYVVRFSITATALVLMFQRKLRLGFPDQLLAINHLLIFAIGTFLFLGVFNLVQFHFGADGSIVTRGLFGVDLPFLAGEVHGIQDFGSLRDLHQLAQSWHYHDWSYQILALLPAWRTLPDLAFAAPLAGYTLLAFSVFAVVKRLTGNSYLSYSTAAVWFLANEMGRTEMQPYALSPSYVFGSILLLNALLLLDLRMKANGNSAQSRHERWLYFILLLYVLFELSQTKLPSYFVLIGGMGLFGIIAMWRMSDHPGKRIGLELISIVVFSFAIVLLQDVGSNPFMPVTDFLIGAPLLGYGNHLARLLHLPVSALNPISYGTHLEWRSLLIVPYFSFHIMRIMVTGPKLPSAVIILLVFRKVLWKRVPEVASVLLIMLPLGLALPVLYSPAWYPLAFSFYAPLVSVQMATLVVAMGFGCFANGENSRLKSTAIGLIGLLFVLGFAVEIHAIGSENSTLPETNSAMLQSAMFYLSTHSNDSAVIATHRYDLDSSGDESYYWYSALSGRTVVSEGAKYGSLLAAVADTNSEKGLHPVPAAEQVLAGRRALLDTLYYSHDTAQVKRAIAKLHASYLLEDMAKDTSLPRAYLYDSSQIVFANSRYRIIRLK